MPTKDKVLTFTVKPDLLKKLEDYRFENRFYTMADALRTLLEKALDAEAAGKNRTSLFAAKGSSDPHDGEEPDA